MQDNLGAGAVGTGCWAAEIVGAGPAKQDKLWNWQNRNFLVCTARPGGGRAQRCPTKRRAVQTGSRVSDAALKKTSNSFIVTRPPSSAMCSKASGNTL